MRQLEDWSSNAAEEVTVLMAPLDGTAERWFGEHLAEREELTDTLTSPILPGFRFSLRGLRRG
ncbi:MAG: hypothetical protein AAFZ38_12085 [Myxococcota bacterium]